MIYNWLKFLKKDLWLLQLQSLSKSKKFLVYSVRVLMLSVRGFIEDQCSLRSSALTLYTLLSIVPVLAMAFGLAKGFALEQLLESELLRTFDTHTEIIEQSITFAKTMLEKTRGGVIAGIGVLTLLWTVIRVLSNIEEAFNSIWGVTQSRSIGRKCSDYLSAILICPFLLILSSSATVLISSQIQTFFSYVSFIPQASYLTSFFLRSISYLAIWILLTFIYIFLPNRKIRWSSGILAGVITGTLFQFFQFLYVQFQLEISNYGAVYGSFAALPLFLLWLQTSWMIILTGAEISFAYQNVENNTFHTEVHILSHKEKRQLAAEIMVLVGSRFHQAVSPWSLKELCQQLNLPIRPLQKILQQLIKCGLLTEIIFDENLCYQPARNLEDLTLQDVVEIFDSEGKEELPTDKDLIASEIKNSLSKFSAELHQSPTNRKLLDINCE